MCDEKSGISVIFHSSHCFHHTTPFATIYQIKSLIIDFKRVFVWIHNIYMFLVFVIVCEKCRSVWNFEFFYCLQFRKMMLTRWIGCFFRKSLYCESLKTCFIGISKRNDGRKVLPKDSYPILWNSPKTNFFFLGCGIFFCQLASLSNYLSSFWTYFVT